MRWAPPRARPAVAAWSFVGGPAPSGGCLSTSVAREYNLTAATSGPSRIFAADSALADQEPNGLAFTVAMPVYNRQETIRAAVADVQSTILDPVPGAELVVVDDGSKDDSGRVLDDTVAADSRVRVIHQENPGHGGALMRALSEARGEY